MLLPGRHDDSNKYRYGFNGKEKDDELKGEGNSYDYGMRIYDSRIGKFLSRDPLAKSYPYYTPYQYAGNTPIQAIDIDGLEEYFYWNTLKNEVSALQLDLVPIPQNPPDISEFGLYQTPRRAKQVGLAREAERQRKVNEARNEALKEGIREQQRLSNPLWLAFEFSPFGTAASSIRNYSEGEYGWAAFDLALGTLELRSFVNSRSFNNSRFFSGLGRLPIEGFAQKSVEQFGEIVERIYKSRHRPSFRKGVVEKVWKNAQDVNGKVYDPNTFEVLEWDSTKSRAGQWDMGHLPGEEWRKLRQDYIDGNKTWKQVLDEYNDPSKYRPESPSSNRSGEFEGTPRQPAGGITPGL